jgi:hypothetical protein
VARRPDTPVPPGLAAAPVPGAAPDDHSDASALADVVHGYLISSLESPRASIAPSRATAARWQRSPSTILRSANARTAR